MCKRLFYPATVRYVPYYKYHDWYIKMIGRKSRYKADRKALSIYKSLVLKSSS